MTKFTVAGIEIDLPKLYQAGQRATARDVAMLQAGRVLPVSNFYWYCAEPYNRGRGVAYECYCGDELSQQTVYCAFTRWEAERFCRHGNKGVRIAAMQT